MPDPVVVRPGLEIPFTELTWRFSRSSGPGGQSVNTTDSRVSLSFDVANTSALPPHLRDRALARLHSRLVGGVLTVHAERQRSQLLNRQEAAERLGSVLRNAIAAAPPRRRPTRPTLGAKERRIEAKKQRGQTKRLRQTRFED